MTPLGVRPNSYYTTKRENYFFDYVKQELIDRYGANTVRKGGLKVYTTSTSTCRRPPATRSPATSMTPGTASRRSWASPSNG